MKKSILFILTSIFSVIQPDMSSFAQDKSPEWTKDLIIYEIATKSFNSPYKPESGTFSSTAKRMRYLRKLGINGIWLAGTTWADDHHFYNIWTQYACMRPDSIDVSLGTRKDMQKMIDIAHKNGIKVFMDVITHGVMNSSPLIKEHPEWFKNGSWGMTDYDWFGSHKDLDEWWVKTFTDYCLVDGFDGFRLDVNFFRADLWKKVRQNCKESGKEIVIIQESLHHTDNMADLFQNPNRIAELNTAPEISTRDHVTDPGKFYSDKQEYYSGKWNDKRPENFEPDHFYLSVELSNHDTGWTGYPAGVNPYVAQGSRALFGYNVLFSPAIPTFMSGEEFDAEYVPVPWHAGSLYGDTKQNEGRWLYGSWIQWDQLNEKDNAEMLADVKRMISIRKKYSDVLHAYTIDRNPEEGMISLKPLSGDVCNPYILYQKGKRAMLVAGNRKDTDQEVKIRIPVDELGFSSDSRIIMKDVWNNKGKSVSLSEDGEFTFSIARDHIPMGGLAVWLIEAE